MSAKRRRLQLKSSEKPFRSDFSRTMVLGKRIHFPRSEALLRVAAVMITVCGEALMDVYAGDMTANGITLDARTGGSPFNVAIGLSRLGQDAVFFGGISRGILGDRLVRALANERVALDAVVRLAAPTTLAFVGLDDRGVPDYAFYGHGAADRELADDMLDRVPDSACYHFGSYSMIVEPTASTLLKLVKQRRARSVISWDPNIRLNVEPRVELWRGLLTAMLPFCSVLKVSAEDLDHLFPGFNQAVLISDWLAAGVALVVITRGSAGVSGWTSAEHVDLPCFPGLVVDTVGAGDSFQAAMLAHLAERNLLVAEKIRNISNEDLTELLRFSSAAAAITCSRRGAELPHRSDVERFLVEA